MIPQAVIEACSAWYDVPVSAVKAKCRKRDVVRARHLAMYLVYRQYDFTLAQTARAFRRDHSTVIHASQKIEGELDTYADTQEALEHVEEILTPMKAELTRVRMKRLEYQNARLKAAQYGNEA